MKILVTGAAGFIGSHFALRHVYNYPDDSITILDKLTYASDKSFLDPILNEIKFIEGDIANQALVEKIVKENQIETIVNFAAETHVDNAIKDVAPFLQTNIIGIQTLIEIVKKHPEILLLHISTDEVYGGLNDNDDPCTVISPLNPCNPYSASKASGDYLIMASVNTYGIRARITRCTNNFGPHQADEKFLPTIIRNALSDNPIPIYGEGKQKRDWLYVTDHTDAIEKVLFNGEDGQIYLISANNERANIDTAKAVLNVLNKPHDLISFVQDRLGHDWRYALDSSNTRELGWFPKVSFEQGIEETVKWYKNKY